MVRWCDQASIGVALGTIASLLRWFTTAQFKSTKIGEKSIKDEFKVEGYWTERLIHWRDSPLGLRIGHHKFRKLLHDAKRLILNLCIGVQIFIVLGSKLVLLVSAVLIKLFLFCRFKQSDDDNSCWNAYVRAGPEQGPDFRRYVLLLEGEVELPKRVLDIICSEVDELIKRGKKKKSKNIIKLLQKSVNFDGVLEFDNSEIERLNPREPTNCWSLPIVTLTSIAISLPNITDVKSNQLLSCVSEGLYFVSLIEKTMDSNGELVSIRKAADVAWVGVELYRKWLDKDLHTETIQNLSSIAEKTIKDFTSDQANSFLVDDPLNWPVKVIAANSMYRITQTILLARRDHYLTDDELFERLSVMVSDILVACLTNLAHVIIMMCHICPIKDRERNVRQAAVHLGESEEILEIVQNREIPRLDREKAASIEGWRSVLKRDSNETNTN
ncbi:hypothetical protein CASFOL_018367 [Castilleja foliolosa]|uniref:Uncharacterized protein n=1 Tax=Castilleja foliolosa TaxID=1961234 RepID=A0ABD3D7W8_9LAMI